MPIDEVENHLLDAQQAAAFLNVEERFVHELVEGRRITVSQVGPFVRFRRKDLEDLIRTVPSSGPSSRVPLGAGPTVGQAQPSEQSCECMDEDQVLAGPERASVRLLLKPEEAAMALGLGKTTLYSLITSGELESVVVGRARRVPVESVRAFVQKLRAKSRAIGPPVDVPSPGA